MKEEVAFDLNDKAVMVGSGEDHVTLAYIPSLLNILERNTTWGRVYKAVSESSQELMLENAKDSFNMSAADIVVKMHVAGHSAYEIAEDTGLSRNYVHQTMEALQIEDLKQQALELRDED